MRRVLLALALCTAPPVTSFAQISVYDPAVTARNDATAAGRGGVIRRED